MREKAGGVTEYSLFTPIALPARSPRNLAEGAEPSSQVEKLETLVRSTQWIYIKDRLREYRHQLRQTEGVAGDLGHPEALDEALEGRHSALDAPRRKSQEGSAQSTRASAPTRKPARRAHFEDDLDDSGSGDLGGQRIIVESDGEGDDSHSEGDGRGDSEDDDSFDLALPPPALDFPGSAAHPASRPRRRRSQSFDATFESERATGWHMSDVPLTPKPFAQAQTDSGPSEQSESPEAPAEQPNMQQSQTHNAPHSKPSGQANRPAWWLNISCPTYRDMVELSKLFPLHPLTVEDILQQEPREKVEIFSKLGYYFAIVRAIDERYFKYSSQSGKTGSPRTFGRGAAPTGGMSATDERSPKSMPIDGDSTKAGSSQTEKLDGSSREESFEMKEFKGGHISSPPATTAQGINESGEKTSSEPRHGKGKVELMEGVGGKEGLEGLSVGACNLYLVVFSHGIISFHTEDVASHIDRVRGRMLDPAHTMDFTSDWIFHGLFDSIVDTFFPLVEYVEAEVTEVEAETSEEKTMFEAIRAAAAGHKNAGKDGGPFPTTMMDPSHRVRRLTLRLPFYKQPVVVSPRAAQWVPNALLAPRWLLLDPQAGKVIRIKGTESQLHSGQVSAEAQTTMLRRISNNRKIINGLLRLLTPKNDTVRALRKRLAEIRQDHSAVAAAEVGVHMGDVGDHVVTLLTLLHSGESRLSETHSKYLVGARLANRRSRLHTDEALVTLASVTVTALACVWWLSVYGMNANVPMNEHGSDTFRVFAGVLAGLVCIPCLVATRVYWIKRSTKRKWEARRKAR